MKPEPEPEPEPKTKTRWLLRLRQRLEQQRVAPAVHDKKGRLRRWGRHSQQKYFDNKPVFLSKASVLNS